MEHLDLGIGAGLAALAFWGFVAAVAVAGIWDGIRKRDAQHETVRRLIESGQTIDEAMMEKLSLMGDGGSKRPDKDFYITALWLLPVAPGLAVLAFFVGINAPEALAPILGAAGLVACLGIGFLVAAKITKRWYTADSQVAD